MGLDNQKINKQNIYTKYIYDTSNLSYFVYFLMYKIQINEFNFLSCTFC